jgi:glycine C-acetyltransferase/8-amino-7-oxononanoate synthase
VAAASAALALLEREPWRRYRLQSNAALLRKRLKNHGLSTAPSASHIVPVVLGDNATTMAVCEALLERGFYAQGIRYPSVAPGTSRLRITPMATHSEEEVCAVADSIAEIVAKYPAESIPARTLVGS